MDLLEKNLIDILMDEHKDWINRIKRAEEEDDGLDLTDAGLKLADRIRSIQNALRDFQARGLTKKKSFFGGN